MDPVTHTLAGVTLGNAFFRKKAGRAAVPIMVLASNLPDIDAIVHLTGDPTAVMLRRTFGHSLFLLPLWCLACAWVLRRFWPAIRNGPMLGMIGLGVAVHLFFDLINSFGVVVLWPFWGARPELAWVFIIDFALTGILALPLLLSLAPRLRPRIAMMSRAALATVACYLALCGFLHHRALQLLERTEGMAGSASAGSAVRSEPAEPLPDDDWVEVESHETPDFFYVFPEPLGPHRWRGVARVEDTYHLYVLHPLTGQVERRRSVVTRIGDPRVAAARATPFGRRVEWFFKAPVWEVGRDGRSAEAWDLRFKPLVVEREAVFRFTVPAPGAGR
ncbi:MAG TPA: metal-dependent hydrolase [Candidatus Polarisedimenticolia bacterium]|nr:metal-dependent hydrolase [Candidatus Polarisedimenticolia bacterium]